MPESFGGCCRQVGTVGCRVRTVFLVDLFSSTLCTRAVDQFEKLTSSALHYDVPLGNDARTLLTEALELTADDRAELAAELLASLDDPTSDSQEEVDRLWAAEIERRSNRVLSGESSGEPWDEARRRIESELAAR